MNNKLWSAGEAGVMRYSGDGGSVWTGQVSNAPNDLHDIQFLNESSGFSGGSGSTIIFSSNSGTNWISRSAGINFGINGIHFLDLNTGWGASDGGIVYKTNNSGLNWIAQNTGASGNLNEVFFLSENNGWTVGNAGAIYHYFSEVPVELTSFISNVSGNSVELRWSTATENNNAGFQIERNSGKGWIQTGFVNGKGNSTETVSYTFTDAKLAPGKYSYRLKQTDFNGDYKYYNLQNEVEIIVSDFELLNNYPNPFNPSTTISFVLRSDAMVQLKVYNSTGEEVYSSESLSFNAGKNEMNFNAAGLSSDVYIYSLNARGEAGSFSSSKKMTLLK